MSYTIVHVQYLLAYASLSAACLQEQEAKAAAEAAAEDEKAAEAEEMLTERDIERLQADVDDLQQRFEYAVDAKHSLQKELSSMKERLKAASDMVEG